MGVANRIRVAVAVGAVAFGLVAATSAPATKISNNGCTPGFWKNNPGQWDGYSPSQKVKTVFSAAPAPDRNDTLMEALQGGGGATHILLRASVAAFLNAEHEGVGYPFRRYANPGFLHVHIQGALRSGDRERMLDLAEVLDDANNLGCPLKADEATKKKGK
jgi:hypothetical protein